MLHPPWAADASGAVDLSIFAQYGVLGIVAAGLIWFAKNAHQRERERADRLESENKQLNTTIAERVIPALMSATRAAEQSSELLSAMQREREVIREATDRERRETSFDIPHGRRNGEREGRP